MEQTDPLANFIIQTNTEIQPIDCTAAFNGLQTKEKLYASYYTRASWEGSKICYFQRSYESPALFYLFQKILIAENPEQLKLKLIEKGFTEVEVKQAYFYIGAFFENCGNYKSFGDSKFIPELPKERLWELISQTEAYSQNKEQFDFIWNATSLEIYNYSNPYQIIEFPNNQGMSSYYSSNVTQSDAELISEFLKQDNVNLSPLNTRLIKVSENSYEVLVASVSKQLETNQVHEFKGQQIKIVYGDFAPFMEKISSYLQLCLPFVENDHQKEMINSYITHFNSGSIEEHKNSQRHWIKDKGPIIETNIGFIESYLDPLKVRAEYEGFVSVVNKTESIKLEKLVAEAEEIITNLPWPKEFEVEKFMKPDFTSLDVLTFASSGVPIGINLPNYDDIRENYGFKNVNLGNVYSAPNKDRLIFATETDKDLYSQYFKDSLFLIVALHELLGHGTGKLLSKDKDGNFNFDQNIIHPILGTKIDSWYEVNETWHSKFGDISSGYEECKADSVALYLSCFQKCLDILVPEYSAEQQKDLVYVAWYEIVYSSIKGLQYYNPELQKWGQAHVTAGYAITQVLLEAGEGLVTIEKSELNGQPHLTIHLDKEKIWTVGKEAMRKFLIGLQVYKSTADSVRGTEFFSAYTKVNDEMLQYRQIAMSQKKARSLVQQSDVSISGEGEELNATITTFDKSIEGLLSSFVYHYQGKVEDVLSEWTKHHKVFRHPVQQ